MATGNGSRSGAGTKDVGIRRRKRLATTPYDRPPPSPSPSPSPIPPGKSPNWFSGLIVPSARALASGAGGVIVPSARAIASGAGKIISSVFYSDSESSSSEDEENSGYGYDFDNDVDSETPYGRSNSLKEKNDTSPDREESQVSAPRTETKQIIEKLITQENFSREECNRLTKVLNSRVIDWPTEAEDKKLNASPSKMTEHDYSDSYNQAVQEAKKWFQEKKGGYCLVKEQDYSACNLNSNVLEQVDSVVDSPVNVARSYMRERPPWASPIKQVDLSSPFTTLFKEGTSYSVAQESLSPSKKKNYLASGSWNIHEELRRVRAKATDDMLRTPTHKFDSSLIAVRQETAGPTANKINGPPANEVAEFGERRGVNGFSSPQASVSVGVVTDRNHDNHIEGNCELLSEAFVEVPVMAETNSFASGSQNSLELSQETVQPSMKSKGDITLSKRQGKKSGEPIRRSRRRGK